MSTTNPTEQPNEKQGALHTPGPWTVITNKPGTSCMGIVGPWNERKPGDDISHVDEYGDREYDTDCNVTRWRNSIVETDSGVYPPRMADARLIAAAPDLLDVARTIVAVCDSGNVNIAQLACMETSPLVDAARAAIAKAEGR